jgi:hypothetical protein
MKSRRQPLSEAFVYGSPEQMPAFSFRWVSAATRKPLKQKLRRSEGSYACKFRD